MQTALCKLSIKGMTATRRYEKREISSFFHTLFATFVIMNITTVSIVLFSPTGTSRKVAMAVADGCRYECRIVDATYRTPENLHFESNELVIVSVPVYGGKVAPIALQRLDAMRGNNTPVVPIVVYGNRAYEEAAEQLYEFVRSRGFVPVAVGAFVGEHSYSTSQHPIATGRPDATDLADARAWGKAIAEKLSCAKHPKRIDIATLKEPRNSIFSTIRFVLFVLKQRRNKSGVKPHVEVIDHKCKRCGKCAKLCPTGAIEAGNCLHTDTTRCIKCCACVKGCPTKARKLDTPYAPILSQCFKKRKSPVTTL